MSVGYTAETFGLLIVLAFVGVIVVGLAWRVLRRILRWMGVANDVWALAAMAVLLVAATALGSIALDTRGEHATAVVTSKRETIVVNRRGGWNRTYQVGARVTGASGAGPEQLVNLSPSRTRYDDLAVGDTFDVRMLRAGPLSVVRDARESTRTLVPWTWVLGGIVLCLLLVALWRLAASRVVLAAIAAGVGLPLLGSYRDWQSAENLAPMTAHATPTVREVTRVTEWRLASRQNSRGVGGAFDEFELPQPYDVVELDLTPTGARSGVLGVDAVDVPAGSPPVLAKGAHVDVRYAAADPRDVRLDGHTRRWHWRDMASVYAQISVVLALPVAVVLVWAWFTRRVKRTGRAGR